MKKKTRVILIVAGCLLAAGLIICGIVLLAIDFDFSKLTVPWPPM